MERKRKKYSSFVKRNGMTLSVTRWRLTNEDGTRWRLTNEDGTRWRLTNEDGTRWRLTNEDGTWWRLTNEDGTRWRLTNEDGTAQDVFRPEIKDKRTLMAIDYGRNRIPSWKRGAVGMARWALLAGGAFAAFHLPHRAGNVHGGVEQGGLLFQVLHLVTGRGWRGSGPAHIPGVREWNKKSMTRIKTENKGRGKMGEKKAWAKNKRGKIARHIHPQPEKRAYFSHFFYKSIFILCSLFFWVFISFFVFLYHTQFAGNHSCASGADCWHVAECTPMRLDFDAPPGPIQPQQMGIFGAPFWEDHTGKDKSKGEPGLYQ